MDKFLKWAKKRYPRHPFFTDMPWSDEDESFWGGIKDAWQESAKVHTAKERARCESILQDRYGELSELLATDPSEICCNHYESGRREIIRLLKRIKETKP